MRRGCPHAALTLLYEPVLGQNWYTKPLRRAPSVLLDAQSS